MKECENCKSEIRNKIPKYNSTLGIVFWVGGGESLVKLPKKNVN